MEMQINPAGCAGANLVGRPRSLIFDAEPRAGARAPRQGKLQLPEFEPQQLRIPTRPRDRQLVVRQDIGALLRLAPARGDHHRDLDDAELPGSKNSGVARYQPAGAARILAWPAISPPSSP